MDTHGIIPPQKREVWPIKPPVDRPEKIIPPPRPGSSDGIKPPKPADRKDILPPVDRPEKILPPPCPPQMNTVKVDPTLTKSGWAADAKVTGDVVAVAKQYSEEAKEAAEKALSSVDKNPKIGENHNWWIWNANLQIWEDTGIKADPEYSVIWEVYA